MNIETEIKNINNKFKCNFILSWSDNNIQMKIPKPFFL